MLVRLDPKRNRIAVMSLPRDLAVTIPGYADNTKINQAYDEGGAALDARDGEDCCSRTRPGARFTINSVIDVNFNGFQRAVNYIERRLRRTSTATTTTPQGTGFAAIDIKPGYQRLVGSDALAYVRYRHTDSDLFRNARQQEFLRQAAQQPAVDKLKSIGDAPSDFLGTMRSYFRFDKKFLSRRRTSPGMLKTAIYLADPPRAGQPDLARVGHHRVRGPDGRHAAVSSPTRSCRRPTTQFMTGERHAQPEARDQGQEGQEAGQGVERHRAGERAPRWARTWRCCARPRS